MTQARLLAERAQYGLPAALGIIILVALAYWGGMPEHNRALFFLGVGALLVMLGLVGALGWVLLARPLPGEALAAPEGTLKAAHRQLLALALTVSSASIIVGAYWDEVWHTKYGVPFGQDFFWRPHLMMYFGLTMVIALAATGAFLLWRQGEGSWRARFRANPPLAYLTLLAAFLFYILPADPLWHAIYGEDISAWSLPHILLAASFALISVVAVATLLTTVPGRTWRFLRLTPQDGLIIVALAFSLNILLQLMTTEWDALASVQRGGSPVFWGRPEWLLPVTIAFLATFLGTLATHATRRVGAATAVGLVALGVRLALLGAFDLRILSADAWLVSLPVLVAIDLVAAAEVRRRERAPRWWQTGLAAAAGMAALGLPLLSALFVYPEVSPETFPMMLAMVLVMAVFAGWAASTLGDTLATRNKHVGDKTNGRTARWATPLALALMLGFIIFFIGTATPPVDASAERGLSVFPFNAT